MSYNPAIHQRRSCRLKGRDYAAPGWYFVTICTHQRQHLFGKIQNGQMILNDVGSAAQVYWQRLDQHFADIELDAFVVMPNHVHGIIAIIGSPETSGRGEALSEQLIGTPQKGSGDNASPLRSVGGSPDRPHGAPPGSIGAIVGNYKSVSTRQINRIRRTPGASVWQRNYHDSIIRDETGLDRVRAYIHANPQNWGRDRFGSPR